MSIVFSSIMSNVNPDSEKLKPDGDGYYKVILGAFNVFNSAGAFYEMTPLLESLFKPKSPLMMRLGQGYLRSENGHPKKMPGEPQIDFIRRVMSIDENKICGHIRQIELVSMDKKESGSNDNVVRVYGWVKPEGPYATSLRDSLENPHSNTAFSIRSLSKDRMVGSTVVKDIKHISTWDFVNAPGISIANKHQLAMESIDLAIFDDNEIGELAGEIEKTALKVSTESDKVMLGELVDVLNHCGEANNNCIYNEW